MEKYGQPETSTFWFEMNGCPSFEPQELPDKVDVTIVGGGLLGVAAGYWLTRLGTTAVLLESTRLGGGATGSNAGLFLPARTALEDPALLEAVLREENIQADYNASGHLALASSAQVWQAFSAEAAKEAGGSQTLFALTNSECRDLLEMPISTAFLGGRWFTGGRLIHPLKLLYGLADSARKRGLKISTQTHVTETRSNGNGLVVRTSRGEVSTRCVIYACGGGIGELVPELRREMRLVMAHVVSTEAVPAAFRMGMAVDWGTIYWRQTPEGVIVIGGDARGFLRSQNSALSSVAPGSALLEFLAGSFPKLQPLRLRQEWKGVMDSPSDGRPIVGPIPGRRNQWVASGFNGHGLPLGLAVGRHVADSILTGNHSAALARFDPARLECLAGFPQIQDQQSLLAI